MDKLSKSQAGKLGFIASRVAQIEAKANRISSYNADPKKCFQCGKPIEYEKRTNKFCSSSCAATSNNTGKLRALEKSCLFCGTSFRKKANVYCSQKCSSMAKSFDISAWENGTIKGHSGATLQLKKAIRLHLIKKADFACIECGWNKRHPIDNRPLVEVDHIDGDASNTMPDNLRVLCPNCHSMTPTFRARNRNSARKR